MDNVKNIKVGGEMEDVPEDLLHCILARFPLRSVCALRVLSKSFKCKLEDSKLQAAVINTSTIASESYALNRSPAFLIRVRFFEDHLFVCDLKGNCHTEIRTDKKINVIAAACNGLFWACLDDVKSGQEDEEEIPLTSFIGNPSSGGRIGVAPIPPMRDGKYPYTGCSMNFDPATSVCTLVRVGAVDSETTQVDIYTTDSQQWRSVSLPIGMWETTLESPVYSSATHISPVYSNGYFLWVYYTLGERYFYPTPKVAAFGVRAMKLWILDPPEECGCLEGEEFSIIGVDGNIILHDVVEVSEPQWFWKLVVNEEDWEKQKTPVEKPVNDDSIVMGSVVGEWVDWEGQGILDNYESSNGGCAFDTNGKESVVCGLWKGSPDLVRVCDAAGEVMSRVTIPQIMPNKELMMPDKELDREYVQFLEYNCWPFENNNIRWPWPSTSTSTSTLSKKCPNNETM